MTDLSFSLPDDLADPLKSRLADGRYADTSEYLLALVRRDLEEAADAAWVRAMIEEGEASGYSDASPHDAIEEIIAERHARRG